jgi:chromosome segregation ATPase
MRYFNPLLYGMLALCVTGLWGCGQQKNGAFTTKIRELEVRYTKLEEDFRTLQSAGEQTRKHLSAVEAQRAALEKEKAELSKKVEIVTSERETLRRQISQRTSERDAAQAKLTQFNRDLQALATRVEAALNDDAANPTPAIIPASRHNE